MQIKDIMTRNVECISPDDTLAQAATLMRELDIGSLPVCGDDNRLIGMITDRDITVRATAGAMDPSSTHVSDVMSPSIVYCFEEEDVNAAAQRMQEQQIRRLVVLDRDKRLVGIVSLGDLAVETQNEVMAGETLESISEPAQPRR